MVNETMEELGKLYGYPKCCVDFFIECRLACIPPTFIIGKGPWQGTGFMPCAVHAVEIHKTGLKKFVQKYIVPHRAKTEEIFPNA